MPSNDIYIDPDTNDIVIENGRLKMVTGADAGAQRIRDRLNTLTGEWFLDLSYGITYKKDILIKGPVLAVVESIFKTAILASADAGSRIIDFALSFNRTTRELDVIGSVQFPDETEPTDISQPVGT